MGSSVPTCHPSNLQAYGLIDHLTGAADIRPRQIDLRCDDPGAIVRPPQVGQFVRKPRQACVLDGLNRPREEVVLADQGAYQWSRRRELFDLDERVTPARWLTTHGRDRTGAHMEPTPAAPEAEPAAIRRRGA